MRRGCLVGTVVLSGLLVAACRSGGPRDGSGEQGKREQQHDPLGANAGCFVCHMTFVGEELTTTHLQAKISCANCHGVSAAHANDEDIGATRPDVRFTRDEVNPFCRTCHETHDVAPEVVIARWLERATPTSQPAQQAPACTDCHGRHKIGG